MNESFEHSCSRASSYSELDDVKLHDDDTKQRSCPSMKNSFSTKASDSQKGSKMSVEDYERAASFDLDPSRKGSARVVIQVQNVENDSAQDSDEDPFEEKKIEPDQKSAEDLKIVRQSQSNALKQVGSFMHISEQSHESDSWHAQSINMNQSEQDRSDPSAGNSDQNQPKPNQMADVSRKLSVSVIPLIRKSYAEDRNSLGCQSEIDSPMSIDKIRRRPQRHHSQSQFDSLGNFRLNIEDGKFSEDQVIEDADNQIEEQGGESCSEEELPQLSEDTDCDDAHDDEIDNNLPRRAKICQSNIVHLNAASRFMMSPNKMPYNFQDL